MTSAARLIRAAELAPFECHPWPRHLLSQRAWFDMTRALQQDPSLAFVALWADPGYVHALFQAEEPLLASVAVEAGLYAALSPARPGATLFERMVADLWGHQAADSVDVRPWLDHGTWPILRPLADRPTPNAAIALEPDTPDMREAEGDALTTGPLDPTLTAPAYWQVTLLPSPLPAKGGPGVGRTTPEPSPGTVASLEARLGWSHRGLLALTRGAAPTDAARLAARIDGTASIAHATAFARAVEAAAGVSPPPAAIALREVMLTLERIATGLHDIDATAAALGRALPAAAQARESVLRASAGLTGHRLMFDAVRPGGVTIDPSPTVLAAVDDTLAALPSLARTWPPLGPLALPDALALAVPGPAGRASGRQDPTDPIMPLRTAGTLADRMALRTAAIASDVEAARIGLANVPAGPTFAAIPLRDAEGLGVAQGPSGPVWHWVRLTNAIIAAHFAADPAWLLLPAHERAARDADPAHLPALGASFALRPAALDL